MEPDLHRARARLATAVSQRRKELLLSIRAAARLADNMSPITWKRVENAQNVHELTYAKIERALHWASGSVLAVLRGGEPAPLPGKAPTGHPSDDDRARYPDDPALQHLWDTPDPDLRDEQRLALIELYLALKRTSYRLPADTASQRHVKPNSSAM